MKKIIDILEKIALEYPPELVEIQLADLKRIAFHIQLVLTKKATDITVCDLGGGIGLFSVGCAALGIKSILIDDFQDEVNHKFGDAILDIHKSYGVQIINRDLITQGIDFAPESIDAFTSFDSMEHWHHSPKQLLEADLRYAITSATRIFSFLWLPRLSTIVF